MSHATQGTQPTQPRANGAAQPDATVAARIVADKLAGAYLPEETLRGLAKLIKACVENDDMETLVNFAGAIRKKGANHAVQ